MTTRNTELFYRIAAVIEFEPERYSQRTYGSCRNHPKVYEWTFDNGDTVVGACGTAHCIAGWAVVLSGYKPSCSSWWHGVDSPDGDRSPTGVAAAGLLGITYDEANTLFSGRWEPPSGVSVPDELRRIGDGGPIRSGVTHD